ncbi:MAG: ABC transporter permease [Planctomycetota bacterium]
MTPRVRLRPSPLRVLAMPLRILAWIAESTGRLAIKRVVGLAEILAVLLATMRLGLSPASWTPPVRQVLARQLLFTAVDSVSVSIRFGAAVGVLVIVQAAMWVDSFGINTEVITPLLWKAIVRELAPLLACLVVIGRSGVAIATELATMRTGGEIELLDAQGVDPMNMVVMPRVLAVVISTFCLALLIATVMVATGYAIGWAMDAIRVSWRTFLSEIAGQLNRRDLYFFVPKTLLSSGFAAAICCLDGLQVKGSTTEVPRVSSRAGIRALTAVLAVSAILSLVIYGRILVFQIG